MNYVEQFPIYVIIIFLAAIKTPYISLICAIVLFFARLLYAGLYVSGGPNARTVGALSSLVARIVLYGYGFYTCYSYIQYHPSL